MSTANMSTACMNHVLTIQTKNQPVVLERLLQVTRYRGFEVAGMEMKPMADFSGLLVTLSIVSDKPISLLTNQLNKLYDIEYLDCVESQQTQAEAGSMRAEDWICCRCIGLGFLQPNSDTPVNPSMEGQDLSVLSLPSLALYGRFMSYSNPM